MSLDYFTALQMRQRHPAWRLLLADHAPLIVSFLDAAFIQPNVRSMAESALCSRLEDQLFALRESEGDAAFPRSARQYLDDWAHNDKGWLRKFYPLDTDEAHYDLTPAAEKAVAWLDGLTGRRFVGTESRLRTVFELLTQMLEGAETDADQRLADLEKRRAGIDAEIERVRAGDIELMDETALRERFQQLTDTARDLLSDFREVEHNFRQLDRQAREQIATWDGRKGDLLEQIFGERDAISDSDQGKTFRAFWDFLMSPSRQEELSDRLEAVLGMAPIRQLKPDPRLKRIHFDWLEAGEQTQRTVARLSQQLRRFLDDQVYLENRRIMDILHQIEASAVAVREQPPGDRFMSIEQTGASMTLPMERPLFSPPIRPLLVEDIETGDESVIDAEALFMQQVIDRERLRLAIRRLLGERDQATLGEVIAQHPLEHGLAELVTYLALAGDDAHAVFDEQASEKVEWRDADGIARRARIPRIVFTRKPYAESV